MRTDIGRATWVLVLVVMAELAGCKPAGKDKKDTVLELEVGQAELSWQPSGEPVERAPISLTTTDGAGLALVSLQVRTVVEEPLAFTELHMRFRNPEDRRREGRFEIALPQEAAISRFAMRIGSQMQEGEIVERKRAAQIYEDFLHRRQDPALLENDAGNEFAARVFPIDANEEKEIILSYSEEIASRSEPYRVRLEGLPALESLAVDIRVGSSSATGSESTDRSRNPKSQTLTLIKNDFAPTGDLQVSLPRERPMALRNGELVVARVVPVIALPEAKVDGLTVLFDTSASRALGFGAQIERLGKLVEELLKAREGRDFPLRVVAFDQQSEEIYQGPASGFGMRDQAKLLNRGALGASSLEQALAFVAESGAVQPRLLLVSDGVITAGASDTIGLREAIAKLAAHGAQRLDALAEGGIQDRDALLALTSSGLRDAGTVLDARKPAEQLADRMLHGVKDKLEVLVSGATWVHPAVLTNVQSADERLIYAEIPSDAPVQIELRDAGAEAYEVLETPRPLLERAATRARIASLTERWNALRPDAPERAELEASIVNLSIRQRVLSDFTALLVLESDADYRRYAIDQQAVSEILTIGDEGIELTKRRDKRELQIARDEEGTMRGRSDGLERMREAEAPTDDAPTSQAAPRPEPASRGITEGSAPSESRAKRASGPEMVAEKSARLEAAANKPTPAPVAPPPPSSVPEAKPQSPAKDALADVLAGVDVGSIGTSAGASAGNGALRGGSGSSGPKGIGALQGESDDLDRRQPPGAIALVPELEPSARVHGGAVEGMPADEARAALRALSGRAKQCYARGPGAAPGATERMTFEVLVSEKGTVNDAFSSGGSLQDRGVQSCILAAIRQLRFPKPSGPRASIMGGVELSMVAKAAPSGTSQLAIAAPPRKPRAVQIPKPAIADAYEGVLAEVLGILERKEGGEKAVELAEKAVSENPGDVMALIALGEASESMGGFARAARAYGSLIDLFPSRADLRRMAGERLERLPREHLWLATDTYRRAFEQRPDHPSSHRLYAYALVKEGKLERAFEVLENALDRGFRADRFEGADRILREDLALVGEMWMRAAGESPRVLDALEAQRATRDQKPSLRFVLNWETDANDVDFHIYDGRGGHAFYQKPKLASGGELYADITTGYGPECFAIPGAKRAYPYTLQAHYFARGPMGFGMGKVQMIDHDGKGNLRFADFPFVIMKDKAFVQIARPDGRPVD